MSKDCCEIEEINLESQQNKALRKVFWIVLAINFVMFLLELGYGLYSRSNALIADSLDMLGDTFVYGISLFVLTKSHTAKANASLVKGSVMALLGLFVVGEAIHKIINPIVPTAEIITVIGIIALVANLICFWLLTRHKHADLNLKSAWICSRNDVMANASVIVAGLLVGYFNSMWPDIIVGLGIAFVVLYSSVEIIKDAYRHKKS